MVAKLFCRISRTSISRHAKNISPLEMHPVCIVHIHFGYIHQTSPCARVNDAHRLHTNSGVRRAKQIQFRPLLSSPPNHQTIAPNHIASGQHTIRSHNDGNVIPMICRCVEAHPYEHVDASVWGSASFVVRLRFINTKRTHAHAQRGENEL